MSIEKQATVAMGWWPLWGACLWHRLKCDHCNARKLLHQQNLHNPHAEVSFLSQQAKLHVDKVVTAVTPMFPPISNTLSPKSHAVGSEVTSAVAAMVERVSWLQLHVLDAILVARGQYASKHSLHTIATARLHESKLFRNTQCCASSECAITQTTPRDGEKRQ